MLTTFTEQTAVCTEHAVLCRNLGAVQERCSRIFAEQSARIAALETTLMRLRARAIVLETELAWATEAGVQLANSLIAMPATQAFFRAQWSETNEVLCQVACLSQGNFWLDGAGLCRRSGCSCVVRTAEEILERSGVSSPD